MAKEISRDWAAIRREWPVFSIYQRFETAIAFVADLFQAAPESVMALAALVLSLGVTYWLMRERDDHVWEGRANRSG
jgi:hypothetical protein